MQSSVDVMSHAKVFSNSCGRGKHAVRDVLLEMLWYAALSGRSSTVSETAL